MTLGRLQSLYVPTDKMRNASIFLQGCVQVKITQSHLTLWPHGLYNPWNSPGQNTGVGSLSLLQGIFPTQGLNPVSCMAGKTLYQLSHKTNSNGLQKTYVCENRLVLSFCDPKDCSPQGSSVHGIFQAKILEWVAIAFSRGSS